MRSKKILIPFALFIFVGAIHQVVFSVTPLRELPMLMSTMRAKEFCSCYFMLNKGKDYCLNSVKKGYPLFDYAIDEEKKTVIFKNYFATAKAKVEDKRYGCTLN
jgi:hypothetical protein